MGALIQNCGNKHKTQSLLIKVKLTELTFETAFNNLKLENPSRWILLSLNNIGFDGLL